MIRVVKKINNNVALCVDSDNKELIAFSKGIGFKPIPYEISDMSLIDRTFYSVKNEYIALLEEIPADIIKISNEIVEYARTKISHDINESLFFVLADHINYAIVRAKKDIFMRTGLFHDIQIYHPEESKIAVKVVNYINKKYDINLPKDEAGIIAMHIFEAENKKNKEIAEINNEKIIDEVTLIIEREFDISIDQLSFNYSRFVSHIQYLLLRRKVESAVVSKNRDLFGEAKTDYPKSFECVNQISKYFSKKLSWNLSDEEHLYLILHINRMCYREDCNQKGITS